RNLIFEDFWLKLFSLVLAVLVWVTVSFAFRKEASPISALNFPVPSHTFFNLPVLVMSSAQGLRHFMVVPSEVAVTVQGEARLLQSLQSKDIRALVDLTGLGSAEDDVNRKIEVSTPSGVTHVQVVPSEVKVVFPAKNVRQQNP